MSIKQDTISPVDDAMPWIMGTGRECVNGRGSAIRDPWSYSERELWVDEEWRVHFTAS